MNATARLNRSGFAPQRCVYTSEADTRNPEHEKEARINLLITRFLIAFSPCFPRIISPRFACFSLRPVRVNLRPRFTTDFFSRKRKRRNNEQQKIPENESFERFDRIVSEKFLSSSLCFFFFSFLFSSSCCSHEKTRRDSLSSPLLSSIRIPAEYFNDVSSDERPKIYGDERIFFPQIFSHHNASSLCRMNSPSSSPPPPSLFFQVPTTVQGESKPGILGVVIRRVCESNEPRLPARNFSILTSPFSLSLAARRTKGKNGFRRFLFEE